MEIGRAGHCFTDEWGEGGLNFERNEGTDSPLNCQGFFHYAFHKACLKMSTDTGYQK
jgi:hypothetical protein